MDCSRQTKQRMMGSTAVMVVGIYLVRISVHIEALYEKQLEAKVRKCNKKAGSSCRDSFARELCYELSL